MYNNIHPSTLSTTTNISLVRIRRLGNKVSEALSYAFHECRKYRRTTKRNGINSDCFKTSLLFALTCYFIFFPLNGGNIISLKRQAVAGFFFLVGTKEYSKDEKEKEGGKGNHVLKAK